MHGVARFAAAAGAGALVALGVLSPVPARAGDDAEASSSEAVQALVKTLAPSIVHVEVTVRYDEGDAPETIAKGGGNYGGYVIQERPIDLPGLVLAPDRVLITDPQMHPRFVAGYSVVQGAQRVGAKPFAWATMLDALILALDAPLTAAKPIQFDASLPPPYRGVYHGRREGVWTTYVGAVMERIDVDEEGRVTATSWSPALVVDKAGKPVGVSATESVDLSSPWKGSPLSWPTISAEEREKLVARTESQANAALLRVHVRLRSPKTEGGGGSRFPWRFRNDESQGDETERNVPGLLVSETQVLVLDLLDAKTTARIESIEVHPASGDPVKAEFVCSYKHFGAMLVDLPSPMPGALRLAAGPMRLLRDQMLLGANLKIQGERRSLHCSHHRISSFSEGWRRQIVPDVSSADDEYLFDRDGALVAISIRRRLPERENRWRRDETILLPSEYLAPLLKDPAGNADPDNVPVAEDRENRQAWLGVETQRLNRDLARANAVSHLTQDGSTGALVSYVYPGSPAEKAGIQAGAVLLRIHAPDRPRPIDVAASEDAGSSFGSMFSGLEDMEDGFADMMPGVHPWPTVENDINRTLTDLGFGKTITIEFAVDGDVKKAEMQVVEGPVHFESAPLKKSEGLGTTVRDLTYEVRRYYQIDDSVKGVIVSKVERGTRAAVAGLKRFDIVLRVNDQPVADSAAFAKAVEAGGEMRLTVKDRLKERVIKIGATAPAPAAAPGGTESGDK
jgi:hypothetical protein